MSPEVTAVVVVPAIGHGLLETLDSLERQSAPVSSLVLLSDTADERAAAALRGLCGPTLRRRLLLGVSTAEALAEVATPAVLWMEAGDVLDESFLARAAAALAADATCGWVTAQVTTQYFTGLDEAAAELETLDERALLIDPWRVARPALYSSPALARAGGPDPSLGPLACLDLWLRLIAEGSRGSLLAASLIVRRPTGAERETPAAALDRFVERHAGLLRRLGPPLLLASQERLETDAALYRELLRRRDDALAEVGRLEAEMAARRETLRRAGADGVVWGELRSAAPVSRQWGEDRGEPIDRYYINAFIRAHRDDLRGVILEVQEHDLADRWGGGRVERMDVVDIETSNPRATLIADLRCASHVPDETYDCFILTQTLHVIADMPAALREARRILKPGGVLLVTLPAASRVCVEYGREGDFWRTTEAGARVLFDGVFAPEDVEVTPYGNLLTTVAFLHGLACHELSEEEFTPYDPWYPLLFGVRAVKPGRPDSPRIAIESETRRGAVLLYHRVGQPRFDPHRLAIPAADFAAQMLELATRFQAMELTAMTRAAGRRDLAAGAVALTFDDAYEDALESVSPILSAHRVPATFFAVAGATERPEPFWWDVLAGLLLDDAVTPARLELAVGERRFDLAAATVTDRHAAHDLLYPALVRADGESRRAAMNQLLAWANHRRADLPVPLDRRGLLELARRPGHAVGAHGLAHLALAHQSAAHRQPEIVGAKGALEGILGRPVVAFSYPYGDTSSEVAREVRAAGYEVAVACESDPVTAASDPWRLPRIEIHSGNAARFGEILRAALGLG